MNRPNLILTVIVCIFHQPVFSQIYMDVTKINQTMVNNIQTTQVTNIGPSSASIMYAVDAFVSIYKDAKREKLEQQEASNKLNFIKQQYNSYDKYPDSIQEGWHNVIVTDNMRFCREAKVFVKENKIIELAIDDCIRVPVNVPGRIKKAKQTITLNPSDHLTMADVYFLYDIEEPVLVPPPGKPGFICFWTQRDKYIGRIINLNGREYLGVTKKFNYAPDPGTEGTTMVAVKPGKYSLKVTKSGNDLEDTVEVISDKYLIYNLN